MSGVQNSRRGRWQAALVGSAALIAAAGLVALPAVPASADVPPLQLTITDQVDRSDGSLLTRDDVRVESQQFDFSQYSHFTCAVDFGDGGAPGGYFNSRFEMPSPCFDTHSYAAAGTYTVTMTVTDTADGDSETASQDVTIQPRQVSTVTGRVEGSLVSIAAPDGAGQVHWTDPGVRPCFLTTTEAHATRLGCADEGTYVVVFDGDTAADSGEYDVSFANGAPRPSVTVTRFRGGTQVPSPRVGTGDSVGVAVDARDPTGDWRAPTRTGHPVRQATR